MDIAYEIKSTLSMASVAEMYGFHPNRAGYVPCPFHNEKTASLRIYSEPGKGFHCFGCGVGGSVIDFAMHLFNLSFPAALVRLNSDFGLGLSSDKPDPRALDKLKHDRAERDQQRYDEETTFRDNAELFRLSKWLIANCDPDSVAYATAVKRIDYLDWWTNEHLDPRAYTSPALIEPR